MTWYISDFHQVDSKEVEVPHQNQVEQTFVPILYLQIVEKANSNSASANYERDWCARYLAKSMSSLPHLGDGLVCGSPGAWMLQKYHFSSHTPRANGIPLS